MTDTQLNTAIITVTYHCEDFIESFLQALEPELLKNNHLFIVDNQSGDQTLAKIEGFIAERGLQDQITLLPQAKNLGFGAGCNAGVAAARPQSPQYYWFLNPDTQVFADTHDELVAFVQAQKNAGFVCSQLVNEQQQPRPSGFRFPGVASEFCGALRLGIVDKLLASKQVAIPVSEQAHRADWLTGASFLVLASAFEQLGGFDETFFLYFEEVDLCYRASQENIERWVNPASKVYHIAGASTGIASGRKALKRRPQYWFDSRRYFYCKNRGRFYFLLVDLVTVIGLSLFKLRATLQRKSSDDPPHLLKDYVRNSLIGKLDHKP